MAKVEALPLAKKQIDEFELNLAPFKQLKRLDLSGNRIRFPRQLEPALEAPILEELNLLGNPISKELADFRLYIIAHSSVCLRLLNEEVVTDNERCQAWLRYPEKDPFKNPAARAALAVPITSALEQAYAATGAAAAASVLEAQAAAVASKAAAERDAEARRLEVLQNKAALEHQVAEEQRRAVESREQHERLLADTRRAERGGDAVTSSAVVTPTVADEPTPVVPLGDVSDVKSITTADVAMATPHDTPAQPIAVRQDAGTIADLTARDASASSAASLFVPSSTPALFPTSSDTDRGTSTGDAAVGGARDAWWSTDGADELDDTPASAGERARARVAAKKRQDDEMLAKARAVAAAKRAGTGAGAVASPVAPTAAAPANVAQSDDRLAMDWIPSNGAASTSTGARSRQQTPPAPTRLDVHDDASESSAFSFESLQPARATRVSTPSASSPSSSAVTPAAATWMPLLSQASLTQSTPTRVLPSKTTPLVAAAAAVAAAAPSSTANKTVLPSTPVSASSDRTASTLAVADNTPTAVEPESFSLETTAEALQATIARYERQVCT
jgi:hypothetical protein